MISKQTLFYYSGLILLTLARVSFSADYYVSPTGTATWANCSGATPLNGTAACSWQTAMSSATAGEVVYFRGGIYETAAAQNPANSGSIDNYITFMAFPGETVIIHDAGDGGPAVNIQGYSNNNKHHIIIDGFTFDRDKMTGYGATSIFRLEETNNIILRNCDLIGRPQIDQHNGSLIAILHSHYIYIYNNKLHGISNGGGAVNASAMWIFDKDHFYIYNNDIYDNFHGVSTKVDGSYIYIHHNHFWNCTASAFNIHPELSADTDFHFYNNVVRNCRIVVSASDAMANPYYNIIVYNNTMYSSTAFTGVQIGSYGYNYSRNSEIYNNILYSTSSAATFLNYYTGASFPEYSDNNLFYGPGGWNNRYVGLDGTRYTSLSEWTAAMLVDGTSITANPVFINVGGTNPEDYKLQAGSLALTSGRGGTYPSVMGAYITGNEVIGYVDPLPRDTTPPARPKGLRIKGK